MRKNHFKIEMLEGNRLKIRFSASSQISATLRDNKYGNAKSGQFQTLNDDEIGMHPKFRTADTPTKKPKPGPNPGPKPGPNPGPKPGPTTSKSMTSCPDFNSCPNRKTR